MIGPAQVIAEEWLFEDSFRCILTEWVSGDRANRDLGGLLWSGFRLRGQQDRRVAPIPVLVQILFSKPFPTNTTELEDRMRQIFGQAANEWVRGLQKYGNHFEVAP
jgi:hypothetical protein